MRALALVFLVTGAAAASESTLVPVELDRSSDAVRRGAQVVVGVCMNCHSLRYVRYRDLSSLGFTPDELRTLQGDHAPEDRMLSGMDAQMALDSFGREPPDQSLLAKAREGGAQYIYSIVTGYEKDKNGDIVNSIMPEIKMPDVLGHADAQGADRAAVRAQARDAAVFLEWAADPRAEQRKLLGKYVLAYLVVLTTLLYLVKRRVWAQLPPRT